MSVVAFDVELDVRQLECPLPILRAKKSFISRWRGTVEVLRAGRLIYTL